MPGHRRYEGELVIDHRESPGITAADIAHMPAMYRNGYPVIGKGQFYESAVNTCSHCQRGIIINPLRTRERHYCRGCDRYICDNCALLMKLGASCSPFWRQVERIASKVTKLFAPKRKELING